MNKSIYVATPMYGGMATMGFINSFVNLQRMLSYNGISMEWGFIGNESLIPRARNALVKMFLGRSETHLLFIDSDIVFNPEDVLSMIDADVDVLAGVYPKKGINWIGIENAVKKNLPTESLPYHGNYVFTELVNPENKNVFDKPVEVSQAGTGFMLINREVFNRLMKVTPTYIDESGSLTYEFFSSQISRKGYLLSEDYYFCHKFISIGGKIHAAPWVPLGHTGTHTFGMR
jgi:hypothetical protein